MNSTKINNQERKKYDGLVNGINQVSSILLEQKVSVSEWRKKFAIINIGNRKIPVYPVYYPIGNGIFNIDKSIEDIKYIINTYIKEN